MSKEVKILSEEEIKAIRTKQTVKIKNVKDKTEICK
jgi:hypothetical protein